jgi:DNA-binding Lrp family transcriptional regulator
MIEEGGSRASTKETKARILALLKDGKRRTLTEIAKETGINRKTVSRYATSLERAGEIKGTPSKGMPSNPRRFSRTEESLVREARRRVEEAEGSVITQNPQAYVMVLEHGRRLASALIRISDQYSGNLDDLLSADEIEWLGMVPGTKGTKFDLRNTDPFVEMAMEHLRTGYPKLHATIAKATNLTDEALRVQIQAYDAVEERMLETDPRRRGWRDGRNPELNSRYSDSLAAQRERLQWIWRESWEYPDIRPKEWTEIFVLFDTIDELHRDRDRLKKRVDKELRGIIANLRAAKHMAGRCSACPPLQASLSALT